MTEGLRKLLVDADSAVSLIFYRKRSAIRELGGDDFVREVGQLIDRLRAAEALGTAPLLCPVHKSLEESGNLEPYGNCIACIRNERDELREEVRAEAERQIELDARCVEAERASRMSFDLREEDQ